METVTDFIFLVSKITMDSDCSHEIKKHLLFGRKVMTNLDHILKCRDITFSAKVLIVKAMVFPVVMCMWEVDHKEGWELKNWCLQTMVLEKTLKSLLDSIEIKPVNPKGKSPEYSLAGLILKLKLQYFGHLMRRANWLEKTLLLGKIDGRRRGTTEDEMVGWHHWLNGHKFEKILWDSEGQESLACCCLWGNKELAMTEWLSNKITELLWLHT